MKEGREEWKKGSFIAWIQIYFQTLFDILSLNRKECENSGLEKYLKGAIFFGIKNIGINL